MTDKEKRLFLAKEWFLKAQDDEKMIEVALKERGGSPNVICFLSQQIAEKCLKGFLTFHQKRFPKIHFLDKLLNLCKEIDLDFAVFDDEAKELSEFYMTSRYPGDYLNFNFVDAERAFDQAIRIKNFVMDKIYKK